MWRLGAGVAVSFLWVKTLALAIIQDVPKLAGRKNITENNGDAYLYSGRFPVSQL